jgi:branched-chain amino acid transport system substrate-binding protein
MMSLRPRSLHGLLLAGTAAALVACGSPRPVGIGIVGGEEGVAGVRFAVDEINATGGIDGQPLTLRAMADGGAYQANLALTSADTLSRDPSVIGVVGHSNSSASLAASQVYNASRLVHIAPTSSAPLLSSAGPYTFRLVGSDVHQAQFLARHIVAARTKPRVALLYVNDDYGHALHKELVLRLADAGVSPVYESRYAEGAALADAPAIARAVVAARTDVLVWLGRGSQMHDLLVVLRPLMPKLVVMGSDGLDALPTALNADGLFTGIRYVCFVDMRTPTPVLDSLMRRYRAKTGISLTVEAALSYDAAMLIATAARAVGPRREAVREYLASLGRERPAYPGATGAITFDENGDPTPSYCLDQVAAPSVPSATQGMAR